MSAIRQYIRIIPHHFPHALHSLTVHLMLPSIHSLIETLDHTVEVIFTYHIHKGQWRHHDDIQSQPDQVCSAHLLLMMVTVVLSLISLMFSNV